MRRTDYFKLGTFIVAGAAMLVFVVIVLGAGRFFSRPVVLETYFNEAVNGLEIGSPVRFRGVKVGRVAKIDFVMGRYTSMEASDYRYVYVECELDSSDFLTRGHRSAQAVLDEEIANGLRMRPISQGLTGTLYLGIDYFDPVSNPPLPIAWVPDHLYVPSAPSIMSRIESAVADASETISSLDKEDIEAILKGVRSVAENLASFLERADAKSVGEMVVRNLEQTEQLFMQLNKLLRSEGAEQVLPMAHLVMTDVHDFFDATHDDMVSAAKNMRITFDSLKRSTAVLEQAVTDPETDIAGALADVRESAREVRGAAARFQDLMSRMNGMVASEQASVEEIVENARLLIQNLKELTEEARRYPSGVLFGQPPEQETPGGSKEAQ